MVDLISEILNIENLGRLRLSSLESSIVSDDLICLFNNDRLCSHLHLLFQSGDDAVLKLMNKRETTAVYYELIAKVRRVKPLIGISCDIMTGFPNEEEVNFSNTLQFLKDIKPMRMHIFKFSPREKTVFAGFRVKKYRQIKARMNILKEMADNFAKEYAKKFLDKKLYLVVDRQVDGYSVGYTENYIRVFTTGAIPLGSVAAVKINRVGSDKIFAKLI